MKTHQGYSTHPDKGAKCSKCGEWQPPGTDMVYMEPDVVGEHGLESTALAIHGALCMGCYEEI